MKKEKSAKRRLTMGAVLAAGLLSLLSGCGSRTDSRRIVRIGHNQSVNHPTHLALTAFQEMIGERLGDRCFAVFSLSSSSLVSLYCS